MTSFLKTLLATGLADFPVDRTAWRSYNLLHVPYDCREVIPENVSLCCFLLYHNTFPTYNNYRQLFQIAQSSKSPSPRLSPDPHTPLHSNLRQSVGAKPCLIKAAMAEKTCCVDQSAPKGSEEDGCPQTLPPRDLRSHLSHSGGTRTRQDSLLLLWRGQDRNYNSHLSSSSKHEPAASHTYIEHSRIQPSAYQYAYSAQV